MGGFPSVIMTGLRTPPTAGSVATVNGAIVYANDSAASSPFVISGVSAGSYSTVTFNNVYSVLWALPNTCTRVYINNSYLGSSGVTNIVSVQTIEGTGFWVCPNQTGGIQLTSISTGIEFLPEGTENVILQNSKLDATSVNHILTSLVDNGATTADFTGAGLYLNGGTAAGASSLTSAGIAARDALVAAGWIVTLNA
jgi:hypothetical protein